jgi:hypothetical protein
MYFRLVGASICALFWGFQAQANTLSIDCTRTEVWAEQEVCRTPALVRLDEVDLALFRALRTAGGLSEGVLTDQRAEFLAGRKACQTDAYCLEAVYLWDVEWLASQLGGRDPDGGYWAVATDGSSMGGLTLRSKAKASAKAIEVIPARMPLEVLDRQGSPNWWQVRSLITGAAGWVPRAKGGHATLIYQPSVVFGAETQPVPVAAPEKASPAIIVTPAPPSLQMDMVERAEYDAKLREIAALNAALSELRAQTEQGTVPLESHAQQTEQLAAANQALADLQAKLQSEFVARADFDQKVTELGAVNAALSDMRLKIEEEFVPKDEYLKTFAELDDATAEIADLNRRIDEDYVPRGKHEADVAKLMAQIDALNQSVADQRETLETQREEQVSALNATLVDSQSRIDTLKRRLSEVQTALSSFIDECTADVDCATAMSLQP